MKSIWEKCSESGGFSPLSGDVSTDVLIVGGGMAGLLTAYMLRRAGVDCILVEADRICRGVTAGTTAKITAQHGLIYSDIIRSYGKESARLYFEAQSEACEKYADMCRDIPCDYEVKDSYVYSTSGKDKVMREVEALTGLGAKAEFSFTPGLPLDTAGAVCLEGEAQFNPLRFAYGIARDLPIFENTKVLELGVGEAITNRGRVRCKKTVVATHFPILNKHGGYFLKLYQHRSYVIALEGARNVGGMYVDEANGGLSFRNYKNFLLLGGGGHRTGKRGGGWSELEAFAKKHYKGARIVAKWATQDCMTLDGIPYIGQYSRSTPDLYVATGFNKWGMSSSMVAATLLTDLITGKGSKYEGLFSPSRSILHRQLLFNAFESLVGLLTPTVPRCPHLGCALKYNAAEHSWDCPCHGSRFSESGELLNNPATDDRKPRRK